MYRANYFTYLLTLRTTLWSRSYYFIGEDNCCREGVWETDQEGDLYTGSLVKMPLGLLPAEEGGRAAGGERLAQRRLAKRSRATQLVNHNAENWTGSKSVVLTIWSYGG